MVFPMPAEAIEAMEQSHEPEWVVTAFYGDEQTIPSDKFPGLDRVPLTSDGNVTFDADGATQANGSVYLAYDDGASLVPEQKVDPLAPYGQELSIARRVHYSGTFWDIPLGRYRIEDVPETAKLVRGYPAGQLEDKLRQIGWRARLDITDLFDVISADDFLRKKSPTYPGSTWDEIQLLSPLPIVRSLPDAPVPSGITYRGRMDAITQLMSNIGGEPQITRQGALTARRANNWLIATDPVAVVKGTVEVSGGMSNKLKNSVYVTNPSDATILGHSEITNQADPLCVDGPLGRRSEEISDTLMNTQVKAQAASVTALQRLSTQQSQTVRVKCLPRPDIDLGDYIEVDEYAVDDKSFAGSVLKKWFGEVRRMEFSLNPTDLMSLELTVAETR